MPQPDPSQPAIRSSHRLDLRTDLQSASALSPTVRDEMYALFARAYTGTDRARFDADLAAKRDVLLLYNGAGRIVGFTTLALFEDTDRGRPIRCLFSGDTVVDPAYWGTQVLNFAWIRHVARVRDEAPETPLYWLLISKGVRTYRYLSAFAHHYVPGAPSTDDPDLCTLRDRLASRLFGPAFDPVRGIVTHDPPREHLAPALAGLPRAGRAAIEAQCFARLNPGYIRGDELVCLCPLEPENMRPFARRLTRKARA